MKRCLAFFSLIMVPSLSFSAPQETKRFTFGGGLNVGSVASEIGDDESPDMVNFVNDRQGASFKRNGSKRYISQAISSNPVNSLFRAYVSTRTEVRKALLMTTRDKIYYSTDDVNPSWILVSSNLYHNQRWNWVMMNKLAIGCQEGLYNDIKQFDIVTGSYTNLFQTDGSTTFPNMRLRAKYPLVTRNYLLLANVVDVSSFAALTESTTYYPSRVHYSLLAQQSSFTATRYLDIRTDDGEEITGVGELNLYVHIFKESSISELDFTVLNLSPLGGDQVLRQIVKGFGLYASATLQNIEDGYILGTKDGLRFWDGARRSRLTLEEESRNISVKIKPIIDRCIKAGTWRNAVGKYYPKKQWYVLSVEDPLKHPRGRNNFSLVYDLTTGNWFPFKNWLANCFTSMDGIGDNGELLYGDEGYVHYADVDTKINDSRLEMVIDPADSTTPWLRSIRDIVNVKEGTGAIKIHTIGNIRMSSTTFMKVINAGEFYDKSRIIPNRDKLSFKVYVDSLTNLSSFTVSMERRDITGEFDNDFSSVSFSSSALTGGNTSWTTIEVLLSSFPIRPDWISLSSETLPFADTLTFYGIRFVMFTTGVSSMTFDDVRIVQGGGAESNPLNAYRYTKQFDFGTTADKRFRMVVLNRELSANGKINIDVINNFGQISKRIVSEGGFPKELFVCGYGGTMTVAKLNSVDFSLLEATSSLSPDAFDFRYGAADREFVYVGDKTNDRLVKINRSSMNAIVFASTYGALGSGTTNFNVIHQIDDDDDNLAICDTGNNRIKIHRKNDFGFVAAFGQLGLGATSYHAPTGIAADKDFYYVGNEGNSDIKKITKSSGGLVLDVDFNVNTVAEVTLKVDDKYLFAAYNSISDADINFKDVILERRDKQSLDILQRVVVKPVNVVVNSTYAIKGSISLTSDFVVISFTDDDNGNGSWYIQKRLKSDVASIADEYKSNREHFTPIANGLTFKPTREDQYENLDLTGAYLQLNYSESDPLGNTSLDNSFKLFNQAFLVIPEPIREKK